MRITLARMMALGALVVVIACVSSCDALGLAHPVNNDGSCAGNLSACSNPGTCVGSATIPCHNVGANVLNLAPDSADLAVGELSNITATYGGSTLTGFADGPLVPATISDSSVIAGTAFYATALSVGTATISATYNGSQAMVTFTIHQTANGVSAFVFMNSNSETGAASWSPISARVQAGWTVQFNTMAAHNITFDAIPGAPANIPALSFNPTLRIFSTVGTFPYHCTLHGEAGVVNVVAP